SESVGPGHQRNVLGWLSARDARRAVAGAVEAQIADAQRMHRGFDLHLAFRRVAERSAGENRPVRERGYKVIEVTYVDTALVEHPLSAGAQRDLRLVEKTGEPR